MPQAIRQAAKRLRVGFLKVTMGCELERSRAEPHSVATVTVLKMSSYRLSLRHLLIWLSFVIKKMPFP